jgi:hypothetical protein
LGTVSAPNAINLVALKLVSHLCPTQVLRRCRFFVVYSMYKRHDDDIREMFYVVYNYEVFCSHHNAQLNDNFWLHHKMLLLSTQGV